MPTYVYRCRDEDVCNREFEVIQKITDEPLTICPSCDGETRRVIKNGNFVRKGVNWERDGYSGGMDDRS
ncbi:MAG: zinc ribbon domain-containing protein [Piscirickettsiaceae bacterium]|nr:zinc ribbon domain-containing protein [Piscirickettsiaceae bacterium]